MDSKQWVESLIKPAGITLNGENNFDIKVLNPDLYKRIQTQGTLGLGESYMDGWWECDRLDEFFYKLLSSHVQDSIGLSFPLIAEAIKARLFNMQSRKHAYEVGQKHYDIGNDLFTAMLGESMAYSCGYFKETDNLDSAQFAKFDLICKKLNLKAGQKILDIGCGWGSFDKYAAEKYGVEVTGATISKEQAEFAKNSCKNLPVKIFLEDYRNLNEKFDAIVSVGMIEHVGVKNYQTFFQTAKKCLKKDGLFLLHTIGGLKSEEKTDPWTNKYIFPNGMIPSLKQLTTNIEGIFVIEDLHNFGADYDKTLMAWYKNFENSWPALKINYDERFHRMWKYYLLSCAGAFRARSLQLWQIVLSSEGVKGGYKFTR
ncbi:MAG: cyclopropane fatty acyl phospholipid synthase [Candidatus Paceibacterota bacterium]|jgi:cyclopropane-fatty-acyl-phospholipid synthase